MASSLPAIPAKRYFTIGEVADLCDVKPHVLRYWEQEFVQLKPMKRRGNRRYYQHHEVLMVRRIRELLYEQGFTISGARNRLRELVTGHGRAVEQQPVLVHPAQPLQGKSWRKAICWLQCWSRAARSLPVQWAWRRSKRSFCRSGRCFLFDIEFLCIIQVFGM
jgi:DNA-binding transcriptional MerR regulator